MLKEFVQHIQETAKPQIVEIGGVTYIVNQDGNIKEVFRGLCFRTLCR